MGGFFFLNSQKNKIEYNLHYPIIILNTHCITKCNQCVNCFISFFACKNLS